MTLDLTAALVVFLVVVLGAAAWRIVRGPTRRSRGPLPDVPDASPTAVPLDAPGLTPPYSSLDPTAPTTRVAKRAGVDETREAE